MALKETKGPKDQREKKEPKEFMVKLVPLALTEITDPMALKDKLVHRDPRVIKDQQVLRVLEDSKGHKELLGHKELKEKWGQLAKQAMMDQLVIRAIPDYRENQE